MDVISNADTDRRESGAKAFERVGDHGVGAGLSDCGFPSNRPSFPEPGPVRICSLADLGIGFQDDESIEEQRSQAERRSLDSSEGYGPVVDCRGCSFRLVTEDAVSQRRADAEVVHHYEWRIV
jgi:hypothetical protein